MNARSLDSLGDVICRVAKRASPCGILPAPSVDAVAAAVRHLPADLSQIFGFETYLSHRSDDADFFMRVSPEYGGPDFLAGDTVVAMSPRLLEHEGWRRIRKYCKDWATVGTSMNADVHHIWFEFDVSRDGGKTQLPAIFFWHPSFGVNRDADARAFAARQIRLAERSYRLLHGVDLSTPVSRTLARVLDGLDPEMSVYCVGVFLGRQAKGLRLCVKNATPESLLQSLDRLDWTGDSSQLHELLQLVAPETEQIQFQLEVEDDLTPRMHLELRCGQALRENLVGRWSRLLNVLIEADLVLPERAEEFIAWDGTPMVDVRPGMEHNLYARILGHVKLTLGTNGVETVKGYIGAWEVLRIRKSKLVVRDRQHRA